MASINSFHATEPAISALDDADILLVYDASAGRTKRMTWSQTRDYGGAVQTASTSESIANNGLTIVSSAMNAKVLNLDAPTAGVRKTLCFLNSSSTSTAILASSDMTVTFDSTTCYVYPVAITAAGQDRTLELMGVSTSQYAVIPNSTNSVTSLLFSFTTS
jgi:hypothetical protein